MKLIDLAPAGGMLDLPHPLTPDDINVHRLIGHTRVRNVETRSPREHHERDQERHHTPRDLETHRLMRFTGRDLLRSPIRSAPVFNGEVEDGKKNLVKIPLNGQSVPHEQKGKFGGARVFLIPASHGTGVIAGGAVRSVLESVGIHDVLSKSQGSSNPHNVVKATFDALLQMRSAHTVAKQRGVSLEKVFKG